jgi:hypothetical protein
VEVKENTTVFVLPVFAGEKETHFLNSAFQNSTVFFTTVLLYFKHCYRYIFHTDESG